MNGRGRWLAVVACFACRAAWAQDTVPPPLREARALLDSGLADAAAHAAEQYTRDHPHDARGFLLLGDAWMKQESNVKFRVLRVYREAERLAPQDPAPPYRIAQVGLWLGSDDGEYIAREGLERVLELDPFYRDAWAEWLTLFRNTGSRDRMRRILGPHLGDPEILGRLALLAIEDERYAEADGLLDSALVNDSSRPAWLALRAQSDFEAGDTISGWSFYRRALAHADLDSTDVLWHQVIGIAWPYEVSLWQAGVPPERKRAWLESFWARRNPNLFAGVNHRVAEHFARLRFARKHYALLHPLISYHRSQIARAMNLEPSIGERAFFERCEMYEVLAPPHLRPSAAPSASGDAPVGQAPAVTMVPTQLPGVSLASDRASIDPSPLALLVGTDFEAYVPHGIVQSLFAPLNLDLRSMDSVAARVGYNLATGLDDRGVMYLRFGPPDQLFVGGKNTADPQCSVPDVERWRYAEYGEVRFARPSAFSTGERNVPDMVFRAMNQAQFGAVQTGLSRDASSEPAPLEFGIWTAQFRDVRDTAGSDLVVVSTRGAVAASLEATAAPGGVEIAESGSVVLRSTPGRYVLVAQAQDSGLLGRQALAVTVRPFAGAPTMSDLLLAPAWDEANPDRAGMLRHVERSLIFRQGTTIRSYAEVYGLRSDAGTVRYQVRYEFLRTNAPERDIRVEVWRGATELQFDRVRSAASAGPQVETLDIVPAQVPPGKYLLRVWVRDLVADRDMGRGSISFAVR